MPVAPLWHGPTPDATKIVAALHKFVAALHSDKLSQVSNSLAVSD